jgi:integrase
MAWARRLPSGRWQGQYRDPSGKVRAVGGTYAYRKDARDAADEQESSKRRGTWADPTLAKVRFSEWAEHYTANALHRRSTTMAKDESYLKVHLLPAFGDYPLGAIEPIHVQRLIAQLAATRAPASVAIAYRMLTRIMSAAVESGYISRSPCRGVKLPRVEKTEMRFLSAPELERLADAVPARYRALVLTSG